VRDHVQALLRHLPDNPFDFVVANSNFDVEYPPEWRVKPVRSEVEPPTAAPGIASCCPT